MAAEAVVSFALETLRDLVFEETRFLWGVNDQVDEVRKQLRRMKAFLKDADARVHKEERVKNFVQEIKELAYRAEDILEMFFVEVASKRGQRGAKMILKRFACIFCECIALHKTGSEITNITNQIASLTGSLETCGIRPAEICEPSTAPANENQNRQTYPFENEEFFVGMKNDITQLVSLLLDNNRQHRVISIYGMGGLGKTTLAKKVYNHGNVRRHFEGFAWSCVTQKCDKLGIFRDIIRQLAPEKTDYVRNMEERQLVTELYTALAAKSSLVVIDDIWRTSDWDSLSQAFPKAMADNKILLTTRNGDVAEKGFPYPLGFLSEEESLELLHKIAFADDDHTEFKHSAEVKDIGTQIVKKCGYLPLAVSVLAGVLSKKSSLTDWNMVNHNIDLYLNDNNEGKSKNTGGVIPVLDLSYDELPYHLKPCFLYLGAFPEDYLIRTESLYHLWIAEGMILSEHRRSGETMRDVAQHYLIELVDRCMIQAPYINVSTYQRYPHIRLHDLMRDLSVSKAEKENFLQVVGLQSGEQNLDTTSLLNVNPYRVAVYMDDCWGSTAAHLISSLAIKPVRSALFLTKEDDDSGFISVPLNMSRLKDFKFLRVLRLEDCDLRSTELPDKIDELILLRFLSLNSCRLNKLPSSLGKLVFLQTIDLCVRLPDESTRSRIFLPQLKQLRHFVLPPPYGYIEVQLDGLNDLETLVGFDNDITDPKDLFKLKHLRYLEAKVNTQESLDLVISYASSSGVQLQCTHLEITCDLDSEEGSSIVKKLVTCSSLINLQVYGRLGKLPSYGASTCYFPQLAQLVLKTTYFEEDAMEILEKLPNLQFVTLDDDSFVGKEMICHGKGFPRLRVMVLKNLPKLENWRVDEGAMPNLVELYIDGCERLKMIPDGLRFISTLKKLKIMEMPKIFCDRVRVVDGREGEDFEKIRLVPSITIKEI